MAMPKLNSDKFITITDKDRVERTIKGVSVIFDDSLVTQEPEEPLPSSICPVCGCSDVRIFDGHCYCQNTECLAEMTFRLSVTSEEVDSFTPKHLKKTKTTPIKQHSDIVGDIANRFEILDL